MTTAAILEEIEKQIRGDGDTAELAWALRDEGAVEVVAYVARLLASPSANVRGSAAMTLGQMGEMAAPAGQRRDQYVACLPQITRDSELLHANAALRVVTSRRTRWP
jgi:hypothetical protein